MLTKYLKTMLKIQILIKINSQIQVEQIFFDHFNNFRISFTQKQPVINHHNFQSTKSQYLNKMKKSYMN